MSTVLYRVHTHTAVRFMEDMEMFNVNSNQFCPDILVYVQ